MTPSLTSFNTNQIAPFEVVIQYSVGLEVRERYLTLEPRGKRRWMGEFSSNLFSDQTVIYLVSQAAVPFYNLIPLAPSTLADGRTVYILPPSVKSMEVGTRE